MPNLTSFLKPNKSNGTNSKKNDKQQGSLSLWGKRDVSKGNLLVVHHGEVKSPTRSPRLGFFRRNRNGKSSSNLLKSGSHSCISSTSFSSCGSPLHSPSDIHTPSSQTFNGLPKCNTVADFDTVRQPVVGPQKCSSMSTFCTSSEHYSRWGISLQNSLTSLALSHCSNKLSRSVSRCQSNSSILQSRIHSVNYFGPSGSGETLVLCRLCLCDYQPIEMVELKNCSCRYCKYCLQQYLMFQILDGNVSISCPDGHCERRGEISLDEVESFVDTETFERYQRFLLNNEVDLDPNRTWCPRAGCETICSLATGESTVPSSVCCPTCGYSFCSMCKARWHNNISCEVNARKRAKLAPYEEGLILSDDENASIKRCPLCRIPIERDDGCAQMMCKRCKHVFCWYCLTSLDDDFLLRHYDKGPCKNKLGHSRASVFWHRTQVVGIFAGFGLLLLVASPFLLLVAPCILCSNCKSCESWSDDETSEPTSSSS